MSGGFQSKRQWALGLIVAGGLAACASPPPAVPSKAPSSVAVPAPTTAAPPPPPSAAPAVETGGVTWYGRAHHGKRTASGEKFNRFAMTAAHRTLPFGTMVKVTRLDNGQSIVVRVNDRGPRQQKWVIDVSEAAARQLGIIGAAAVTVRLDIVS